MSEQRDTRAARHARTVTRLREAADELRLHGFTVTEPEDLEIPPHRRIADVSNVE
jgi:hypothetical protein